MVAALLLFLINQSVTLPLIKGTIPRWSLDSVRTSHYFRGESLFVDIIRNDRGYIDTAYVLMLGTPSDSINKAWIDSLFVNCVSGTAFDNFLRSDRKDTFLILWGDTTLTKFSRVANTIDTTFLRPTSVFSDTISTFKKAGLYAGDVPDTNQVYITAEGLVIKSGYMNPGGAPTAYAQKLYGSWDADVGAYMDSVLIYFNSNYALVFANYSAGVGGSFRFVSDEKGFSGAGQKDTFALEMQGSWFNPCIDTGGRSRAKNGDNDQRWLEGWYKRLYVTAADRTDSILVYYDANDTAFFRADADAVIKLQGKKVVTDSINVKSLGSAADSVNNAWIYRGQFNQAFIGDSLIIPLWANHPATATVGSFMLDTLGTDTLWICTQAGFLVVAHD